MTQAYDEIMKWYEELKKAQQEGKKLPKQFNLKIGNASEPMTQEEKEKLKLLGLFPKEIL